jgi:hypothetical protein
VGGMSAFYSRFSLGELLIGGFDEKDGDWLEMVLACC